MSKKLKPPGEWLKQAEYDMDTGRAMVKTKRYIYAVFMCHLSIEKGFKGLYTKHLKKEPPKTHNLNFLAEEAKLLLPEKLQNFVFLLNRLSVPTRYPENLKRMLKDYDKKKTEDFMKKSMELLKWLKEKY